MSAMLDKLLSALRVRWFAAHGIRIGPGCRLAAGVELARGWREGTNGRIQLGADCELGRGAILAAWGGAISIGRHVWVGPGAVIYGHGGIEIGDETLISMHCRILSSNHAMPPMGVPIRSQPNVLLPSRIGRDVWLGAGVTVLGGVSIGDGCIIGAGAVVTNDLPAGSIAMGIPASIRGQRAPRG